jgi:hypothetical protein
MADYATLIRPTSYGIDAHAISVAAETIAPGRPIRHLGVV